MTQTTKFRLKRAIDLIMPPIDVETLQFMKIGDYEVNELITQLRNEKLTGCLKGTSEERLSRAAMLLNRGRVVGCIYGNKTAPVTKPTEDSMKSMIADMKSPGMELTLYKLPEEIALPISALFLGYPVDRNDDYTSKEYLDYISTWFSEKSGTGAFVISLTNGGTYLGYYYMGEFTGAFHVDDQIYRVDRAFVEELLKNDPKATLDLSILPLDVLSRQVQFGYGLRV